MQNKLESIKQWILKQDASLFDTKEKRSVQYRSIAKRFGVSWQTVVGIYVNLKNNKLTPTDVSKLPNREYVENVANETADISVKSSTNIKTLAELIKICEIDTAVWNIDSWSCSKWDAPSKGEGVKQLFSVRAKLSKRKLDTSLRDQKQMVLADLKAHVAKTAKFFKISRNTKGKDCVLEIAIPDLHIGKHSWGQETGEDYDIKIAIDRYTTAIEELLSRTNLESIDRILFPIGNDMINIDNKSNMTTGGTPQSVDSRFGKMFHAAKELLVNTIDRLITIAPVDVVVIPGNHDNVTMFTLGEVIEAWYNNNPNVNVNNNPKARKYYKYGNNSIMFTHGNEEKHQELGLIFATEESKLWADTKFREVQLGHFHKTKRTSFVSVDEFQGFKVRIIPSLSGTDSWHYSKGYNSMKSAQAFLYHKEKGLIAEFTHTI